MAHEVDVVVVGMGVGGEEVAGRLAAAGLSVVGIEHRLVGGECPYWGCVPSKMMIRAANALAEARRVPGLAGLATVEPDWSPVAKRIREEATDDWDDKVAVERFVKKGGRFVRGFDGLAGTPYWTNREAIEVEELPDSLIVLGGGAIGLELAQVFARFGVSVSVVEALDRLVAMEEPEASELAAKALAGDEIAIRTGAQAARVGYDGQQFT